MLYDVASVRGLYASLSDGWTYLNAHDCPQVPERVSSAVARSFRLAPSVPHVEPLHGSHSRQAAGRPEGDNYLASAKHAIADLVGASADRVILGPSVQVLYATLTAAMSSQFRYDSSIVVNRLDQDVLTATLSRANAEVRTAHADLGTGELPVYQYADLIDGSTRLVSFPAAHRELGTVVPVSDIVDTVRDRSRAWTVVDASAYAPYFSMDVDKWGADIVAVDINALGGPQIAAIVLRDHAMLRRLNADVLEQLESTVSPGLAGGVPAAVDHLAKLVPDPDGKAGKTTRRSRLSTSMAELSSYLGGLRDDLYTFLGTWPAVHILGASGEAAAESSAERLPRLTFGVRGVPATTVHSRLVDNGIITTLAQSSPLLIDMGIDEMDGGVTVSMSPFNTYADIEQLIRVVASLA